MLLRNTVHPTGKDKGKKSKGLVVTLDCESSKSGALLASGKATADYKQELFTVKASYDYYKSAASGDPPASPARRRLRSARSRQGGGGWRSCRGLGVTPLRRLPTRAVVPRASQLLSAASTRA